MSIDTLDDLNETIARMEVELRNCDTPDCIANQTQLLNYVRSVRDRRTGTLEQEYIPPVGRGYPPRYTSTGVLLNP